tara:strand:+ start:41 stop:481 length:441 start_codon:yes stop_codon:yes gene_type:complete
MKNKFLKPISKILKITKPFLMVDKITNLKIKKSCIGHKKINLNEWFFSSHFIGEPTMPGTLLIESMLQTSAFLIYKSIKLKNERCIIASIQTKLFKKVNKNGSLKIYSNIKKFKKGTIQCESYINYKKVRVCSASFLFILPSEFKL